MAQGEINAAAGNLGHLTDNVAAGALRLVPEELARLDALHRAGS
jgi:hypothetical protein